MTRLVVAWSHSAVLPRDLVAGLSWCSAVLFLVRTGTDARPHPALLADLGDVVELGAGDAIPWDRLRSFRPDGAVTFSEDLLEVTAEVAVGLGLPGTPPARVAAVRDKRSQRTLLREAGVDPTRSGTASTAGEVATVVADLGVPVVLKPALGAGSEGATLARTAAEAQAQAVGFFARWPNRPLMVEEYHGGAAELPFGDYVSVESLVADGSVQHLGVTGKLPLLPPFRETAQFHPSGLGRQLESDVRDLATAAVEALGLRQGAVHTEIKLTPRGPRLIEVNARLGGYINELYGRVLGCDIIELVGRLACGETTALPRADGAVHFQYTHQPPLGATRLTGLEGVRAVARHPLVARYERLVPVGATLSEGEGTQDLDLLCGTVASHSALLPSLLELRSALTFHFDTSDGALALSGAELDRCVPGP